LGARKGAALGRPFLLIYIDMIKKCAICSERKEHLIRINSLATYMQVWINKDDGIKQEDCFICCDCYEQRRKELEKKSSIEIN